MNFVQGLQLKDGKYTTEHQDPLDTDIYRIVDSSKAI